MRGAEWHFVCNYCEPHGHFRNDERGPADRAGAGGGGSYVSQLRRPLGALENANSG
jgi:hypothetical protein